jgi:hypothetical protein
MAAADDPVVSTMPRSVPTFLGRAPNATSTGGMSIPNGTSTVELAGAPAGTPSRVVRSAVPVADPGREHQNDYADHRDRADPAAGGHERVVLPRDRVWTVGPAVDGGGRSRCWQAGGVPAGRPEAITLEWTCSAVGLRRRPSWRTTPHTPGVLVSVPAVFVPDSPATSAAARTPATDTATRPRLASDGAPPAAAGAARIDCGSTRYPPTHHAS